MWLFIWGEVRGLSIHVCSPENGDLSAVVGSVVRDGPPLACRGFFWDGKGPGLVNVHREGLWGHYRCLCISQPPPPHKFYRIEKSYRKQNHRKLNLKGSFVEEEPFPFSLREK